MCVQIIDVKMMQYVYQELEIITIHVPVRMVFMALIVKLVYLKDRKIIFQNYSFTLEIDECKIISNGVESNPCLNNGTCYDLIDAYYCE